MEAITIDSVKKNGWLIFEAVTGSKAYGLDSERSDTDIRGVFVLPKTVLYSLNDVSQVANDSNDIVYYELRRFIELLAKNNPNIIELLNVPAKNILYRHAIMDEIKSEDFLSKLCEQTYANYAYSQIKKAYGLEKKIMKPMSKERKTVPDFCYVHKNKTVLPLADFLSANNMKQEDVGLSAISHMKDCYNMFYSDEGKYSGIIWKDNANDVSLSSIEKEAQPVGLLYFNKEGYSTHCKSYKDYWDWVEKRNNERYNSTMAHGKKYDAKNMMHVFRLLKMAREIATSGDINVFRKDREFLLSIKAGEFEYDDLVQKAEKMKEELPELFEKSNLPVQPDAQKVNEVLIKMRSNYYEIKEINR